jgi:hypothetical protein
VFNRAGKLLSILAMMAVTINAQCALSCSVQAAQPPKESAHSCCKDHKSPASHKPGSHPEVPCPEAILTIAAPHKSQAPVSYFVTIARPAYTLLPLQEYRPAPTTRTPRLPDIPAFSIIRV